MRIDQLLVERGLAVSRSQAQRLIAAGARWNAGTFAWRRDSARAARYALWARELKRAINARPNWSSIK